MRKVSNIMMLLNGIFSIIGCVTLVVMGIILILFGTPVFGDLLRQALEQYEGSMPADFDPELFLTILSATFISVGVIFILSVAPMIVLAILSFKARGNHSRGMLLAIIIMSAILDSAFGIVGGIFGLIANRKEPKGEVVEAK
jgi:hypothetical protein